MSKQPQPTPSDPDKSNKKLVAAQHEDLPPDSDAEDRFNDFWKRNGPMIFLAIAVVGLVVTGYQTYQHFQERKNVRIGEEFRSAMNDTAALVSFAQDREGRPISGMAYLILANQDYDNGEFLAAADHYDKAVEELSESAVRFRAELGAAMALIKLDDFSAAEARFQALRDDVTAPEIVRAEAAYHLAVAYWQRENFEMMHAEIGRIEALENSGFWGFRASQLRDRVPELREFANTAE